MGDMREEDRPLARQKGESEEQWAMRLRVEQWPNSDMTDRELVLMAQMHLMSVKISDMRKEIQELEAHRDAGEPKKGWSMEEHRADCNWQLDEMHRDWESVKAQARHLREEFVGIRNGEL